MFNRFLMTSGGGKFKKQKFTLNAVRLATQPVLRFGYRKNMGGALSPNVLRYKQHTYTISEVASATVPNQSSSTYIAFQNIDNNITCISMRIGSQVVTFQRNSADKSLFTVLDSMLFAVGTYTFEIIDIQ